MGLWTKLRLFGHGDAEPGLEAAEEMLKRKNEINRLGRPQWGGPVRFPDTLSCQSGNLTWGLLKKVKDQFDIFLALQICSRIYIAQVVVQCAVLEKIYQISIKVLVQ